MWTFYGLKLKIGKNAIFDLILALKNGPVDHFFSKFDQKWSFLGFTH
jgi:hypothetical protein